MKFAIPIGGSDAFFDRSEYHFPKPLVEVDGRPMIECVLEPYMMAFPEAQFVFVVRAEDCRKFDLDGVLRQIVGNNCDIVRLDEPTKGATCSLMLAVEHLDNGEELIIANADQIIDTDLRFVVSTFRRRGLDAGIVTFRSVHPRWSYVRCEPATVVVEAAEKRVISKNAVAGFYYFMKGSEFISAAKRQIINKNSVNGTFYIAPTLNEFVIRRQNVGCVAIDPEEYHSFYSPAKIEQFERMMQSRRIMSSRSSVPSSSWNGGLNVVIPMAGKGSRFADAGYRKPKPFIDVDGRPMVERVIDNLGLPDAHFYLIARKEHLASEPEAVRRLQARGNVRFVEIERETEGTVCSVLFARESIGGDEPLLIANCDQIVDFECSKFIDDARTRNLDGSILVFRDPSRATKWSYVRLNADGLVAEVREKEAISELATVGIYLFRSGQQFVNAALDMIIRNERTNGEFYTCPVYSQCVRGGERIGVFEIEHSNMHGIGTPEDLAIFLDRRKVG